MKKVVVTLATALFTLTSSFAADPSEKGVPTSPLTIYSGGLAIGAEVPINDSLRNEQRQYLKLSFTNMVYFREQISLFCDVDWLIPQHNLGLDFGFDFLVKQSDFTPFMGFGVGARYMDKDNDFEKNFGRDFGVSFTVHGGVLLDVTDALQIRLRVPYHAVMNESVDQTIGFDLGFLFSDPYRKVKKLDYNR